MSFIHSKSRIESFSDAVFAFAATLIVVSFEVPKNFEKLQDLLWKFFGFGLSFIALALLWYVHYSFFRRIEKIDTKIIVLNMIYLFTILFFIYPMKFLISLSMKETEGLDLEQFSQLFQLYGLGFIFIFLVIFMLYYRSSKIHSGLISEILKFWSEHFLIYALVGIVSVTIAYFKIGLKFGFPGFVYGLIGLFTFIHSKKRDHLLRKQ